MARLGRPARRRTGVRTRSLKVLVIELPPPPRVPRGARIVKTRVLLSGQLDLAVEDWLFDGRRLRRVRR